MMKNFVRGAGLLLLAMGSSAAMAVPITGDISFAGSSFVTGTTLNFNNPTLIITASGTFANEGITLGSTATFNPLDYSTPFNGVTSLWTVGDFSFDLQTVTVGATGPNLPLTLFGTGVLMNATAGYDNTAYSWAYSGNGSNLESTLSFSVFADPTSVPEPGSLALLGLGLVGFAVTGYKRRRAQV